MTNDFIFILLWSCFAELVVLAICVPVVLAAWRHTAPRRIAQSEERSADKWTQDATALFGELYANFGSGNIVGPKEFEDRVLDMYTRSDDLAAARRKELA